MNVTIMKTGRWHTQCKLLVKDVLRVTEFKCSRDTQTLIADGVLPIPVMADPAAAQRVRQVPTFEQYDPSMYKALRKSYVKYVKHVSSIEKGTTTATAPDFSTFTIADLDLEAGGYPRVPDLIRNVNNIETNVTQQQIIRSYFTKHYSMWQSMERISTDQLNVRFGCRKGRPHAI